MKNHNLYLLPMGHLRKVEITSEEQWDKFRSGSSEAFTIIYDQHIKILLSYGRKIHNDRQMVADVAQELFANLWARRKFIGVTTSVKFYLFKSLRTSLIKEINKQKNKTFDFENTRRDSLLSSSQESIVIDEEQTQERHKSVKKALGVLSKREQEILYLKYFDTLNNEEISELLKIQYQSVKNTSFSAIKKLRKYFSTNELRLCS